MNKMLTAFVCACLFLSCEKNDIETTPLSSLTIANSVIGASELKLGSNTLATPFNGISQYTLTAGSNNLYIWPAGDSIHPVYNQPLETKSGHIYTLFLAGDIAGTVDPLLVEEDLPIHTDSTFGVRFINMAPGSPNVSIQLTGNTNYEISDLEYKEKSWFFNYPAKIDNPEYSFDVVENATGNLMTSLTIPTARFKNVTLAITGSAENGYIVIQVNHY